MSLPVQLFCEGQTVHFTSLPAQLFGEGQDSSLQELARNNTLYCTSLSVQLFFEGQNSSLHEPASAIILHETILFIACQLASEIILQGTVFFNIHVMTLLMYNRSLKIMEPHSIFKIQKIEATSKVLLHINLYYN